MNIYYVFKKKYIGTHNQELLLNTNYRIRIQLSYTSTALVRLRYLDLSSRPPSVRLPSCEERIAASRQ